MSDLIPSNISRRLLVITCALLMVLVGAKGVAWVLVMPIGQHPDENAHAAYADHLVRVGGLGPGPRMSSSALDVTLDRSAFHEVVFRAEIALPFSEVAVRDRVDTIGEFSDEARDVEGTLDTTAAGYPPLGYLPYAAALAATSDGRYDTSFRFMRLAAVGMSMLAAVVQLLAFVIAFRSMAVAVSAAVFTNMMPMYTATQSAINAEVMLVLLGSTCMALAFAIARRPTMIRLYGAYGVVFAAALLTKPSAAVFIVPLFVASAARPSAVGGARRMISRWLLALAPALLAVAAWRFAPSRPGKVLADSITQLPAAPLSVDGIRAYAGLLQREGVYRFNDLYWGIFGWVDAPMPIWFLRLGAASFVVVIVIVMVRLIDGDAERWVWVSVVSVAATLAMLLFVEYRVFTATGAGMVQGRYLFSLVVAIVALQYWAGLRLFRRTRFATNAFLVALPILMTLAHVYALVHVVIPRYYL